MRVVGWAQAEEEGRLRYYMVKVASLPFALSPGRIHRSTFLGGERERLKFLKHDIITPRTERRGKEEEIQK